MLVTLLETWKKLWTWMQSIALEVSALLFMSSVLMTYLLMQDFVFGRVCRVNLGYSEQVCQAVVQNNGNYTQEENNIQKVMTKIRMTRAVLDYSIPIIFVIFQGSWSDIHGRKLPLLVPCVGFTLQALSLSMSHYFENWDGFTVVLVSSIPKCLSGADVTFRMAALSYASDISTKTGRTLRTGLISAAFTLGVPIGFALGGSVVKAAMKLQFAFLLSALLCATAFFMIVIFVDNKPQLPDSRKDKNSETQRCFSAKNIKSVMQTLVLSFDGVSKGVRVQIAVLVFAIICINAPIQGEFGIMYLYLRKKLSWDLGDYGLFSTYTSLIGVLGTILSMGIFCKILKLSDPLIGFISGVSQFAGCFMYAFAYTNLMVYLAPAVDMLNGTMAVVAKSMLSKLVSSENFGKMFSLLAVIELLVPLVFDPTYSVLYEKTIESFPGSVFLLSAALTVPPQLTYLFYLWKNRKSMTCHITTPVQVTSPEHIGEKVKAMEVGASHTFSNNTKLHSATSTATVDTIVPYQ